jgi:cytoskeletal protein CcmA (bactofilin family)
MKWLTFLKKIIKDFLRKTDRFEVLLGAGMESRGDIHSAGTVRIEGKHMGNVTADLIVMVENSYVRGDMKSRAVIIGWIAEGNVSADELVEVKSTGRLEGFIYSRRLMVMKGGVFNGYASIHSNAENIPALVSSEAAAT